jgi:hypothetical protein
MADYLPNLIQIRPQYTDTGPDTPENVTWWQGSGSLLSPLSEPQLLTIQATFDTAWEAVWSQVGYTGALYKGAIVTDWSSATGLEAPLGAFTPHVGSAAGILGNQTAVLISLQEASRYRGGHGRIYLPAIGAAALATGETVAAAVITSVKGNYTSLVAAMQAIAAINNGPYTQVVFHQKTTLPPRPPGTPVPAFTRPVTNFVVQPTIATQRRRVRKAAHS